MSKKPFVIAVVTLAFAGVAGAQYAIADQMGCLKRCADVFFHMYTRTR